MRSHIVINIKVIKIFFWSVAIIYFIGIGVFIYIMDTVDKSLKRTLNNLNTIQVNYDSLKQINGRIYQEELNTK
jgi:uncharacterized membrane protein